MEAIVGMIARYRIPAHHQRMSLPRTALMVSTRTTGATSRAPVTMPEVQFPCAPGSILSVADHVILRPLLD